MWLIDWIWRRCHFLAEEVEPPLAKPPKMMLIVPRRGGLARVTSMRAGWGSWFVGWFGVYRGESHGEGVDGRDEEDDEIERSGRLCGQNGESGKHAPVLQFYPRMLYSPL